MWSLFAHADLEGFYLMTLRAELKGMSIVHSWDEAPVHPTCYIIHGPFPPCHCTSIYRFFPHSFTVEETLALMFFKQMTIKCMSSYLFSSCPSILISFLLLWSNSIFPLFKRANIIELLQKLLHVS